MQMVAGQQEGLRALLHEVLKELRTRDDVQVNENAVAAAAPSAKATTANAALLEAAESDTHAALVGARSAVALLLGRGHAEPSSDGDHGSRVRM